MPCNDTIEEYLLPQIEALLAGTLALMTALAQANAQCTHRELMAAKVRLRPILMTSLAFGFGVLPLALGTGAGAGGRNAIGTAVLGGMAASTVLGIFLVPVFFLLVRSWFKSRTSRVESDSVAQATPTQIPAA